MLDNNNYDDELDPQTEFYKNFERLINEDVVNEIYNEKLLETSEEEDWDDDEYKTEKEWYEDNKEDLDFIVESETVDAIIEKVFSESDVNPFRLDSNDFSDFSEYIKDAYSFLDSDI